jgi:hypothetical protein
MEHITGNYLDRTFGPFKDQDGTLVTSLGSATTVMFAIKRHADDADDDSLVWADLDDGITVNGTAGTIRVQKTSDEMMIDPGIYPMGIQAEFSDGSKVELYLTENGVPVNTITIKSDVIRGT